MGDIDTNKMFTIRNLLEIAPCGSIIFKTTPNIDIIASNERLWELFECDSEEDFMSFCKGSMINLIAPVDRTAIRELIRKTSDLKFQKTHRHIYRILTKAGNQIEVEDRGGSIIFDDETLIVCQMCQNENNLIGANDINDRLTGVLSMKQFTALATDILRDAEKRNEHEQYTFTYDNIRNFKFYNMKYGRNEGDNLLRMIADHLKSSPDRILVARYDNDHFLSLFKRNDVSALTAKKNTVFNSEYKAAGISIKTGIYKVHSKGVEVSHACDMAKVACDTIRDSTVSVMIYDKELEQRVRLENYIVEHFESAMASGHIIPYYQPVVRTISNSLCGTEALARWIDPEIGFIPPADFIPILEKNHLITKLDLFMLEQICINMNNAKKLGHMIVPTSFNLSKQDFVERNMLSEVEKIVSRHGIARDLINIEITESMIMDYPQRLKMEIELFQNSGYQVWMDDFGSGYSSLNVLKEYPFDEIKLDMLFMRSFDDKSKEIIRATVQMAKRLGIQTLAEGVETKEQYDFLRRIGCEKVQGYYFSKPISPKEILTFAEEKHISMEKRADRHYYDRIGRINSITDRTLAITEFDQKTFKFLFRNEEFDNALQSIGITDEELIDHFINSASSNLSRKFRYLQERTELEEGFSQMDFAVNGQYFRLRSKLISQNMPYTANQLEVINLTSNESENDSGRLDRVIRAIYSIYDFIILIYPDGKFENLMRSGSSNSKKLEGNALTDTDRAKNFIHPEDRREFLSYADINSLRKRLRSAERGYETRFFRSKLGKEGYVWKEHTFQYLPEFDLIIYSTKATPLYRTDLSRQIGAESNLDSGIESALWQSLKYSNIVNLFWKDTDRKFAGGNRKFLDTLGIEDKADIYGKRDEDLNWLIDTSAPIDDDTQILENGADIHNRLEKLIIDGVSHNILVSKEPIYKNGKIAGILGSFVDLDEYAQLGLNGSSLNNRDMVTGLLSAHGIIDPVSEYIEGWQNRQEKFAILRIRFLEQKSNYEEYGPLVSNEIAREIAMILSRIGKSEAVIARLYAGNYVLMKKYEDKASVNRLVEKITSNLKNIHRVAGFDVTIYPEIKVYFAGETKNAGELIAVATGGTEIDLAQREQLEDKLNYYNIQLDTVVDTLPGGIAIYEVLDAGLNIVYASKGVSEISGRTQEEFLKSFEQDRASGMVDQDIEMVDSAVYRAIHNGEEINVTYRLRHLNGKIIWVNMQGRIIGEQNGRPLLLGVFRNLSESTQVYESLLDESLAGIFVSAKKDGEMLYTNQVAVRTSKALAHCSVDDLYKQIVELCTPERKIKIVYGPDVEREKYEIVMNDRNMLVYQVDGIWNGREAKICYVSDITGKYIEECAKAERESMLYLQAINSSYDMIITLNLTQNLFKLYSNDNFLGYDWSNCKTYEELTAAIAKMIPDSEKVDPRSFLASEQVQKYKSGTNFTVTEHKVYDAQGNIHWVSVRVVYSEDPVSHDILAISLTMLIDDQVRERRERQVILQNALDEANSASRAKSQFLSNMSHDIRTPMNAIMGYSAIAAEHLDDRKRVDDCIQKIIYSGKNLQELLNDVLDMSRIESGKDTLEPTDATFKDMEKEVLAIIKPLTDAKNITLISENCGLVHKNVKMDFPKVSRIFINILSNAAKFTGENGKIICRLTEEKSPIVGFGTYTFSIKDNGIGMSESFLEHIYELFSRENTSTNSRTYGTGLGMAIVKKYVDIMGGTVNVLSKQGVGTEVIVRMDLEWSDDKGTRDNESEDLQLNRLKGKRVLVVDDNSLNSSLASIMLEEMGMSAYTAADGTEAVRALESCGDGEYDLVLMDMQMPTMDGITATKKIRASKRGYLQKVPIIALTANAFVEDVEICLKAGMNGHISKPFNREDFIKKMAEALSE